MWRFRSGIPTGTTCTEPEASKMVGTIRGHCRNNRVGGRKVSRRVRWCLIYRTFCLTAYFIRYISRYQSTIHCRGELEHLARHVNRNRSSVHPQYTSRRMHAPNKNQRRQDERQSASLSRNQERKPPAPGLFLLLLQPPKDSQSLDINLDPKVHGPNNVIICTAPPHLR